MTNHSSITEASLMQWHANLRQGDEQAMQRLWDLYFEQMVGVARRKLAPSRRIVRDEEDIALSAFHSFCRGFSSGRFDGRSQNDPDAIWPLLVTLTLNKAVDQIRRDNRLKRGGASEDAVRWNAEGPELLSQLAAASPQPELVAMAEESLQNLIDAIRQRDDEDLEAVVKLSIEGLATPEIADQLGCSQRTVQRKLRAARDFWQTENES
ncbi:MAG: sigma-70 family RNA polymerase sigma factor [Planctomycetota bacterium]